MQHTDQTNVAFPQEHSLLQAKKGNESDGVQYFFVAFFLHYVSGSY